MTEPTEAEVQAFHRLVTEFDAYEKDCFARFVNLSDSDVSELIERLDNQLTVSSAEYDQDDFITVSYDEFRDLLTIASHLWQYHLTT